MTAKVIYVSHARLTDKIARDWYLDDLEARGATVEYWDVVSLVREEHAERGARHPAYLRTIRSFRELEALLRESADAEVCYVVLFNHSGRFTRIFRLLSRYHCRTMFLSWGAMPQPGISAWRRLAAGLSRPLELVRKIHYRVQESASRWLGLVAPFDTVFAAGEVLINAGQRARKVVPINLCDYEHYVSVRDSGKRLVEGRYAVFLDINLPHQSDLAIGGYPRIDPAAYYRALNRFFGMVEAQCGLEVVVAAHPKADYDASTFAGRKTHRLVTAELVKDAELVLSHTSTALSYAVLNVKPLLFIYTSEMLAAYRDTIISEMRCYADYLRAPICNIDEVTTVDSKLFGTPDAGRYQLYKYSFVTSRQSENARTLDIFWREIQSARGSPAGTATTPSGCLREH